MTRERVEHRRVVRGHARCPAPARRAQAERVEHSRDISRAARPAACSCDRPRREPRLAGPNTDARGYRRPWAAARVAGRDASRGGGQPGIAAGRHSPLISAALITGPPFFVVGPDQILDASGGLPIGTAPSASSRSRTAGTCTAAAQSAASLALMVALQAGPAPQSPHPRPRCRNPAVRIRRWSAPSGSTGERAAVVTPSARSTAPARPVRSMFRNVVETTAECVRRA